ncbi:unnamed protein product [Lupinus luteus]|uniref:WAT1-related protein n=1 Tax=Lupinus luteus TaxID=3873 RepID=A0AAV1Y6Q5_LUPLU
MISLQFGYAGMNIITKVSLNQGMSHYVLVVYRHAFATAVIAPFAFIFERKGQPKITFKIFMQIFILALLGMEKIDMKKVRCQAKVVGTIVTVGGAMLMTLYKGPIVDIVWAKHSHSHDKSNATTKPGPSDKEWFLGCTFLIIATLAWASLFVLQGIVTSSISYYVQGLVIKTKGPVFATAFSPLMMIIVAIMGSFILAEQIYLGGVIGSVFIVMGLYSVLWGKHKERIETKVDDIPMHVKDTQIDGNANLTNDATNYSIEAKSGDDGEANKHLSSVVINMKASQNGKN